MFLPAIFLKIFVTSILEMKELVRMEVFMNVCVYVDMYFGSLEGGYISDDIASGADCFTKLRDLTTAFTGS